MNRAGSRTPLVQPLVRRSAVNRPCSCSASSCDVAVHHLETRPTGRRVRRGEPAGGRSTASLFGTSSHEGAVGLPQPGDSRVPRLEGRVDGLFASAVPLRRSNGAAPLAIALGVGDLGGHVLLRRKARTVMRSSGSGTMRVAATASTTRDSRLAPAVSTRPRPRRGPGDQDLVGWRRRAGRPPAPSRDRVPAAHDRPPDRDRATGGVIRRRARRGAASPPPPRPRATRRGTGARRRPHDEVAAGAAARSRARNSARSSSSGPAQSTIMSLRGVHGARARARASLSPRVAAAQTPGVSSRRRRRPRVGTSASPAAAPCRACPAAPPRTTSANACVDPRSAASPAHRRTSGCWNPHQPGLGSGQRGVETE